MKKISIILLFLFLLFTPTISYANNDATDTSTFTRPNPVIPDEVESQFGIDWSQVPEVYEYNWDNSMNCWQYGVWIDGVCYKTEHGKFDTNVRHKFQGYCDGKYVYVRIVFSREFGSRVNGDEFLFYVDDEMAKFRITDKDGNSISNVFHDQKKGTRQYEVRHAGGHCNFVYVDVAYLTKNEHDCNAVLEFRVPLEEMKFQNKRIDLDTIGIIELFNPNLMMKRYRIAGASTYPVALATIVLVAVPGTSALIKYRKKNK